MNLLNIFRVAHSMVEKGLMTREEQLEFTLPVYFRSQDEFLEPLIGDKCEFVVDHSVVQRIKNPIFEEYFRTRDSQWFGQAVSAWVKAWSESFLSIALSPDRSELQKKEFLETFYEAITNLATEDPEQFPKTPHRHILVLTKKHKNTVNSPKVN